MSPARSPHDDAEYRTNEKAAGSIGALYALDNGWDGNGVLVGVLDEGVVETDELKGQISSLSKDFGGIRENGVTRPHELLGDEQSEHGTLVASVIAARNDGEGVQGIAPGSKIVVLRSDLQNLDNGQSYVGVNGHEAVRYAGENGVMIVNRSLSKVVPDIANRLMQDAVADYRRAGGLLVNAAGNSGGDNPNDAIDLTDENREGWLFVVAATPAAEGFTLASYSNRCGIAMDRCVAGIGTSVTADKSGNIVSFSGTSAAAPQASALAALILDKWPQLTGVDAGNIILATAKDIGDAGVDPVFGHGLISVEGALSPVEPMLTNGSGGSAVAESRMILPAAFGGNAGTAGESIETALSDLTILDAYGRDYDADLSSLVRRGGAFDASALEHRFENMANLSIAGFQAGQVKAKLGYVAPLAGSTRRGMGRITASELSIALDGGRSDIALAFRSKDAPESRLLGLAPASDALQAYFPAGGTSLSLGRDDWRLEFRHASLDFASATGLAIRYEKGALTLKAGVLAEEGSVFGSPTGSGALRFGDGAVTAFTEVTGATRLGAWDLNASASLGTTRLKIAPDALLTDAGAINTMRLSLGASRQLLDGRLSVDMSQPLLAISGRATLTYASGYSLSDRRLQFSSREVDLSGTPSPRLTMGYEKFGERSVIRLGIGSRIDGTDMSILATWRLTLN